MRILVNCFGNTQSVDISNSMTVGQLMKSLQETNNLPESSFLTSNCGELPESALVRDMVQDMGSVQVNLSLEGGKGKKRKTYNTPKKNKHKRVNVKLAVLNYYAIENDGTVKRTRRRSEQVGCKNRGIFMASHWNRYYCGLTHLTLKKKDAPKEEPKRVKKVAPPKDDGKKKKGKKGKK